jgi:hypothetical protein
MAGGSQISIGIKQLVHWNEFFDDILLAYDNERLLSQ